MGDPAFADFFDTFGEAALAAGLPDTALIKGWERSFALVCERESYSYRSAMLASRLALISARAALQIPEEFPGYVAPEEDASRARTGQQLIMEASEMLRTDV